MATGFTTVSDVHLRRTNVWSRDLKSLLKDELMGLRFVKLLTDFPDGVTFNIPIVGEAETADFAEGQAVKYNRMDTGNFTFTFSQYKYSANSISAKFKRDSYWSSDVEAMFVPLQHRALMEAVETRILSRGNAGQTASSLNTINSGYHRFVGSGTNEIMALVDFQLARYALRKANVPLTGLTAILDPSAIFALQNQTNAVNLMTPDPQWQEMVRRGATTGMRFMFSLYGFDVYESNYLPTGIAETINSRTTTTAKANQFFAAAGGDINPIIGGFRQMPTVFSEFNKDLQQDEYVTLAEYDFKLYRPENMVTVLTDDDQVA